MTGLIAIEIINFCFHLINDQKIYLLNLFKFVLLFISYVGFHFLVLFCIKSILLHELFNHVYFKVFIAFVTCLDKLNKNKRYNIILMVYWLISLLCALPILITKIVTYNEVILLQMFHIYGDYLRINHHKKTSNQRTHLVLFAIGFALLLCCFVLSFWSDNRTKCLNPVRKMLIGVKYR